MTFGGNPQARVAQASASWRRVLAVISIAAVAFTGMHASGPSFQSFAKLQKKTPHAHLHKSALELGSALPSPEQLKGEAVHRGAHDARKNTVGQDVNGDGSCPAARGGG
jgi:hypothetical protein